MHERASSTAYLFAPVMLFLVVAWAYWPGLAGPLLFDDFANLADVTGWLEGERTWQSVMFGNRSGPGGRPLSMGTFLLDAALWGKDVWHLKLTNLVVHLACGGMVWLLLRRLVARDQSLSPSDRWLPLGLALVWMALPINVSSVLYVVQRMAMLSAFFMFAGAWLYVVSRSALERGEQRGLLGIFVGVPALTALAFFCKENGLLIPALALAIEIAMFQPPRNSRRPAPIRWLIAAGLVVPPAALLLLQMLRPGYLTDGYILRDFTLFERVLTQPRILWDYVASIFVPYGPRLGLFHDNYLKSNGLLNPWTTLPAIMGWILALVAAWRMRPQHPAVLCGLLFFLAGHAMESSILGLELYFEHRNYLPSVGLLLAAAGLVSAGLERMPVRSKSFTRALWAIALLVPVVYLATTHGRARVWSSHETLFAQELQQNPDSPRLRSFLAGFAIEAGDLQTALAHIDAGERNASHRHAMTTSLWRATAYCDTGKSPSEDVFRELETRGQGRIETFAMSAWEMLVNRIEQGRCPDVDLSRITRIGQQWLADPQLPQTYQQVWRTRYNLARLLAHQSRFEEAIDQADQAWRDADYNNGIGVFLFQINASVGNVERCTEIHRKLSEAYGGDLRLNAAIDTFGQALRDGTIKAPETQ